MTLCNNKVIKPVLLILLYRGLIIMSNFFGSRPP